MKFSVLKYREFTEHSFDLTMFLFATKNKKNLLDLSKLLNKMLNKDMFSVFEIENEGESSFTFYRNNESDIDYGFVFDDFCPLNKESVEKILEVKDSITEDDLNFLYNFVGETCDFKERKSIFLNVQKYKKDGTFYTDKKKAALEYLL